MARSSFRARTRQPTSEFVFGTPEEIADRDPNRSLYSEFLPDDNPPAFTQIKPESNPGKSVNRATFGKKSGNYKFAGGPGVP